MTVKSNTPATPKATTPKKRRTRKTSTPAKATPKAVKKTVAPKVTVTTFKGGKAVAKKTTLKRPSTARLITPQRYIADIQTRWAIHNFEIQELVSDFVKGFDMVRPYHTELVKRIKTVNL
jgi:predicted membrane-bound mannosyltransferase